MTVALLCLRNDPYTGKKLIGALSGQYSYEVWPYYIIYQVIEDDEVVLIVRIKDRCLSSKN